MISSRGIFISAVGILLVAATLQNGGLLVVGGVKPNLVLALLATFSLFFSRFFSYAILSFLGSFFVGFTPGVSWEIIALFLISLLFFYIRDRFVSPGLMANAVFVCAGTILFYLLVAPTLLYYEFGLVAKEMLYNGVLAIVFFVLARMIYEKKGGSSI